MRKPNYVMMAAYNAWANRRVYDAAATLPDEEYRADRGAFFKSLHGTLNHLLVTDRIWLKRFTGEGEAPNRLDAILFEDLPDLRAAREREDLRIVAYIDRLDENDLAGMVSYQTISNPTPIRQPLWSGLTHLFNHQTHHRGQAHAILTGMGRNAPSLDLLLLQRETGIGMT
ncbi:DinB family protein [Microvirga pudoricolor]|uniref:DinB family protein n=1 Tax=Microvirga pudoricolor TaxID=2778729 RepID=UPI00194DBDD0|nr:DinB family protein [Microvirga pudoricolor]MBM6596757.1 damage-inducible protein DinB [Microvirga pudoricolor]